MRRQARNTIYTIIFSSSAIYFLLYYNFTWLQYSASKVSLVGFSWTLIPILLIYLYDNYLWKTFNPRLDYTGVWKFEESQYKANGELDYHSHGSIKIVQTTSSMRLVEGKTFIRSSAEEKEDILVASFWSIGCSLDERNGNISMALEHLANPKRSGGSIRYGVEVMSVSEASPSGWPLSMNSKVYHCIGEGEPRIVATSYKRAVQTEDGDNLRSSVYNMWTGVRRRFGYGSRNPSPESSSQEGSGRGQGRA